MNKETQSTIITKIIENILSVPGVAAINKKEETNKNRTQVNLSNKYQITIDEKDYNLQVKITISCFLNTNVLAIGKETQLRIKYIIEEVLKRTTNVKIDVCIQDLVE